MICLSKADQDNGRRGWAWNQSPSPLAKGSTTRQDMSGIANLRELVDAGQDGGVGGSGSGGGLFDEGTGEAGGGARDDDALDEKPSAHETMLRSDARFSSLKMGLGGDGQPHPFPMTTPPKCSLAFYWSWFTWLSSVVMASLLLHNLPSLVSAFSSVAIDVPSLSDNIHVSENYQNTTAVLLEEHLSTNTVRLPLTKRASTCGSGPASKEEYNTPLHAGAVVIIWFVSTLACIFPILAKRVPGLRIPTRFFFTVRHFGTGVLIATAFVHLLPTAFISLGDPCLGSFWTTDYQAMPGAIALAAIFFVTVIEMVFHPSRHLPTETLTPGNGSSDLLEQQTRQVQPTHGGSGAPLRRTCSESTALPLRGMAPLHGSTSNMGYSLNQMQKANYNQTQSAVRGGPEQHTAQFYKSDTNDSFTSVDELKQRKERLQCVLLECGILFHSVFIGMALSVSVGSDFVVLLIAIVFHQTFEGLALGSRIASVTWGGKTKRPWLMAVAYGCTTPLGQAIGLATASLYSPDSEVGLLLVGIMNAISAGLLTYASLVELLSEDFLSDESWRILRGKKRVVACVLVFFGAFFMSLVGAWA